MGKVQMIDLVPGSSNKASHQGTFKICVPLTMARACWQAPGIVVIMNSCRSLRAATVH
jgi:hypothetical protein